MKYAEAKARLKACGELLPKIPERLRKTLVIVTFVYFAGFLWVFTQGHPMRLLSTAYWEWFWGMRGIASNLGGRSFFYGVTLVAVFVRWAFIVAAIAAAYVSLSWVTAKKKPDSEGLK